jgi:diguanylate cyclase (GGDEF)-like protein
LSAVASILREAIRTYDSVARWGGEEFLIALYDLKTHDELEAIANKLLAAVRLAQIECTSTTIQLTYSIGGVLADAHASLDEMIKQADDALYRAKNEGRDRAVLGLLKVD